MTNWQILKGPRMGSEVQADEYSIIPPGMFYAHDHMYRWYDVRVAGTVRHEVFFGTANRKKSIQFRLYVFIKPEDHNMSALGVHGRYGDEFNMHLKQIGQRSAMAVYGWSEEDFIKIFGRSYI